MSGEDGAWLLAILFYLFTGVAALGALIQVALLGFDREKRSRQRRYVAATCLAVDACGGAVMARALSQFQDELTSVDVAALCVSAAAFFVVFEAGYSFAREADRLEDET